jgi:hypothetical protein
MHVMDADSLFKCAPDEMTWENAVALSKPHRWHLVATDNNLIWGMYTRDNKVVYAAVDMDTNEFYCSCATKDRPCRHGLALYLVRIENPAVIISRPMPDDARTKLKVPRRV